MIWKLNFRNILLLATLILTAACSNTNSNTNINTTTPSTEPPPLTDTPLILESPTIVSPVAGNTLCANTYYPIREGATWSYQSSGSVAGNYGFTDTITSVREDGFTLTSDFEGVTRTQEWACKPEGLVALQMGGPAATVLNSQDMELKLEVKNVSGVTYPGTIEAGDKWQHSMDFTGEMGLAGQKGEASGNALSNFTATGIESVTVPAGTFDAMKIQVETTVNIHVTYQGLNVPVTFTGTYAYWFVPNIGWVKASGNGEIAGQTFTENIELQSYNIP
jgi:hypothetical protein